MPAQVSARISSPHNVKVASIGNLHEIVKKWPGENQPAETGQHTASHTLGSKRVHLNNGLSIQTEMTWPHSADARPRIYPQTRNLTRRTRAWTICRHHLRLLTISRVKVKTRGMRAHRSSERLLRAGLVTCNIFFFFLKSSIIFPFPPPAHRLSLRGTRRLSRRCAITSKHVAKEMWSDTEGWRRVCSLKLRCSWVGQGGDTACLIDYLIRLN